MTLGHKKKLRIAESFPHLSATNHEDYQQSLGQIVRCISAALEAEGCSIFLEREPGKFTLEAGTGLLATSQQGLTYYQSGEGLTGWVAKHGRGLRIKNVHDTAGLKILAPDLQWRAKVIDSPSSRKSAFLAVPIMVDSYVLGVIRVTGRDRPFTEEDQEQLIDFSNRLANQLTKWPHILRSLPAQSKGAEITGKRIEAVPARRGPVSSPRIFISYARSDRLKAKRLARELQKTGASIWFDEWQLRVGDSLRERIDDALSTSDYLLILLSPSSARSKWIRKEWSSAFSRELSSRSITVIPVLLADCQVPAEIASRQVIDLRTEFNARVRQFAEQFAVLPQLDLRSMNEVQLIALVQDILVALGFREVRMTHGPNERGYDIEARLRPADPFATEDERWLVQVKSYRSGRADLKTITQMFALVDFWPREAKGLIVTNGQLTSVARSWFESAAQREGRNVRVLDGTDLREILLRHPEIARRHLQ